MAKKDRKIRIKNLKSYINVTYGVMASLTILSLLSTITFGAIYLFTKNTIFLYVVGGLLLLFGVALLIYTLVIFKVTYKLFYDTLFENTRNIFATLKRERKDYPLYSNDHINEFHILNKDLSKVREHYQDIVLFSNSVNYENLNLDYINKQRKVISEKSFKENISNIINTNENYRSSIISITYPIEDELSNEDFGDIINNVLSTFKQNDLLIAIFTNKRGVYIYVPNINSSSLLKEQLETIFKSISISRKTISGIQIASPKIDAVIYPFTTIHEIFSDLAYSKRQNNDINIYIPERLNISKNNALFHERVNQNIVSKLLSKINTLNTTKVNIEQRMDICGKTLSELCSFLSIEQCGFALYSLEKVSYVANKCISLNEKKKTIFIENSLIDSKIISALENVADDDQTYYFSDRNKENGSVGQVLDIFGISSGFFYLIKDVESRTVGFVYFANTNKDQKMILDTYMRESLLVLSSAIGFYLVINTIRNSIQDMKIRENNILKMANISTYTIDKSTHKIVSFSPALKDIFPKLEIGDVCHKAFFNQNSPCAKCPLINKNKIIMELNGIKREVSYSINTKMSNTVELIINNVSSLDQTRNRFDPSLLVNTYYSLYQRIRNLYAIQSRGYIQLLEIDNAKELVKAYGNEGYEFYIRCFMAEITKRIPAIKDMYLFKDDVFAFVLPDIGKLDVISMLEKVYECAKVDYFQKGDELRLNIGYEAIKFPQEYSNAEDLIRHLERCVLLRDKEVFATNVMHIEENDFYRPAGKKEYILSIIEQATELNKFIIKAQPVVAGNNKNIFSAELLIRLSDDYSQSLLNTDELIAVAGENDKLNTISDLLINYVGNLFKQFGFSIFKTYSFQRMSINVDYNFFRQENFIDKIAQAVAKYRFPKNFLTFEVGEENLSNHIDEFTNIIKQLDKYDVTMICDQYTGQFLSLETLRQMNISELKTRRDFVNGIDVQSERFESVKSLITSAKENNIKTTLVGIENGQQYKLISEFDSSCSLQGYYFHHPLDPNELIEAIRKTNL